MSNTSHKRQASNEHGESSAGAPAFISAEQIVAQTEEIASQKQAIVHLTADNISKQSLIAELQHVQQYVQMLNKDLSAQNAKLQLLNNELEAFSFAVSHDLRGPLRSICGFSETLERLAKAKLNEEEKHCLDHICNATVRMGHLIDDMLHLSRITRAEMRIEPVDLAGMAHEIAAHLAEGEPSRQVRWHIQDHILAHGDPDLLRVALDNLLRNSWKYSSRREQAEISFATETGPDGTLAYVVRDNGTGFNMKYIDRLFKPFQRLHSTRDFPGSGIGLATVARVVHRHGGRVWAEAALDRGAAFFFTLESSTEVCGIQHLAPQRTGYDKRTTTT